MVDCMLLGERLVGDANARVLWANDDLSECPNEDVLWGFAIRASGELKRSSREKVDDSVLYHLFHMGLFDWPGRNKLQEGISLGVRFAAVIATRLFAHILKIEEKVHSPSSYLIKRR